MDLFKESFDRISTSLQLATKWTVFPGSQGISAGGRTGQYVSGDSGADAAYWICAIAERDDVMFLGTASRRPSFVTDAAMAGIESSVTNTAQVGWSVTNTGAIRIWRGMSLTTGNTSTPGGTQIGETDPNVYLTNTWHYVWLWVKIHPSAGEFELWVDGAIRDSDTGINTSNDGGSLGYGFGINLHVSGGHKHWDDIVFANEQAGDGFTDVPAGDPHVYHLNLNGNGNYSAWDGSDGNQVDNYLQEDDTAPDGDTTYNHSDDVGDRDSYALESIPVGGTIVGSAQLNAYARKDEAALRQIKLFSRLAGTDLDGDLKTLGTTYAWHRQVQIKPGGANWHGSPTTDADALEIGQLLAT